MGRANVGVSRPAGRGVLLVRRTSCPSRLEAEFDTASRLRFGGPAVAYGSAVNEGAVNFVAGDDVVGDDLAGDYGAVASGLAAGVNWKAYRSASRIANRSRTTRPANFPTSAPCVQVTIRSSESPNTGGQSSN